MYAFTQFSISVEKRGIIVITLVLHFVHVQVLCFAQYIVGN